jgi:hypothetical protein
MPEPYGYPYDPGYNPDQSEPPYMPAYDPQPQLTEKQWGMLLEEFGVEKDLQKRYWSILNHHLQLGKIQNWTDLEIHLLQIEDIIRKASWDDSQPALSPAELQQLLFFVGWLLRKSYEGGTPNERVNLISQYSTIHRRNEETPQAGTPDRGGFLSRLNPWRK